MDQALGLGSVRLVTRLAFDRDKTRNIEFRLLLVTGDDSGLPTGLSLRLLKPLFDDVLFECGGLPHVLLLLSTCIF